MADILGITTPIYLILAAGYLATRRGWFSREVLQGFGQFVIRLALPAMLFLSLASRKPQEIFQGTYLLAHGLGSLALLTAGLWWFGRRYPQGSTRAYATMGMVCPNSGFMGFPFLSLTLPGLAGVVLAQNMILENFLLIPLLLAVAERAGAGPQPPLALLRQTFERLITNPMVIGLALGALAACLPWRLPEPLLRATTLVAQASSALSLFVIGGSLAAARPQGTGRMILPVVVGKLLLHPLATGLSMLLLGAVGGLSIGDEWKAAMLLSAAMPMMGIYPVLAMRHGHEAWTSAALVAATLASFVSINLWLWWLGTLGWLGAGA